MPISSSWGFLTLMKHAMYHFLTANALIRTKINIPNINFAKENSQDFVALQSSLELLFCIIKQFSSNFGTNLGKPGPLGIWVLLGSITLQPSQPLPGIFNLSYPWVSVFPEGKELLIMLYGFTFVVLLHSSLNTKLRMPPSSKFLCPLLRIYDRFYLLILKEVVNEQIIRKKIVIHSFIIHSFSGSFIPICPRCKAIPGNMERSNKRDGTGIGNHRRILPR